MTASSDLLPRDSFIDLLHACFEANSLSTLLADGADEKLYQLSIYLLEQNERGNLTAITDAHGIISKHLADSVAAAALLPKGARIVDIGSGAGFPALPLAICRSDLQVIAIESNHRKVDYINSAAALVGANNIRAICARAEEAAAVGGEYRESFDIATARGVAELRVLCELCIPFVRRGGSFIALKGKRADEELAAAKNAISMLGGRYVSTEPLTVCTLGGEPLEHCGIIIKKEKASNEIYPRPYAKITKRPL